MSCQFTRPQAWAFLGLAAGIGFASAADPKTAAQNAADPHVALIQDFQNRVAECVKLHEKAEAELPGRLKKPNNSPESIEHHQHELREAIVALQAGAVEGNIFTPRIGTEFRRLIGMADHFDARPIRESLLSGEPATANVHVRLNKEHPDNIPLQTMDIVPRAIPK